MNVADSQRVSSALEGLGYMACETAEAADVIVLNTCVVRQSAEDKAMGRLTTLLPLKAQKPGLVINLMGCMVGVRGAQKLRERLPYVDVFSPPSDPGPLVSYLSQSELRDADKADTNSRFAVMDGDLQLPDAIRGSTVSVHVPVVYGCSHACTFCVIPLRRGGEQSRPAEHILAEVRSLAQQGVREVTLLGQIVDRYGRDLEGGPDLGGLLKLISTVDGIERIRFLTSHPNYFTPQLMDAVAALPKVMPHIEVPIQAGDNTVLKNMRRGYTQEEYRDLIAQIRERIPHCGIATDIIVGFPGETHQQFMQTMDVLRDLRLDVAHTARYSSREGTVATRQMVDDVPEEEKMQRFRAVETQQESIVAAINAEYLGKKTTVLFEGRVRGRWRGRTPTNKLVFAESEENLLGALRPVQITWTGPWSMQGQLI